MKIEYEKHPVHPDVAHGPVVDDSHHRPVRCWHREPRDFALQGGKCVLGMIGLVAVQHLSGIARRMNRALVEASAIRKGDCLLAQG